MAHDRHWLWHDTDVLVYRRKKAAAAVDAVARALQDEPTKVQPATRFVSAYRRYGQFSARAHEHLAGEPYTYYWGRLAYELLQLAIDPRRRIYGLAAYYCRHNRLQPHDALNRHLDDFSRLLAAAALIDGVDLELEVPLRVAGPFALPGTPLSIDEPGETAIHCVRGSRLHGSRGNGPAGHLPATSYPVLEDAGCRIRMQPAVFNIAAAGITDHIPGADYRLQVDNREHVTAALALLRDVDSASFSQIREVLRVVAAGAPGPPGSLANVSHCDLPGAIVATLPEHPHECANIILHEFLHNRLFALEEREHFIETEHSGADSGNGIYSPWRSDSRPAHGLLHAVYVFTGIGRYWLKVIHDRGTPEPVRKLAGSRVLRGLYQVRIGMAQLRRRAAFTDTGGDLMDLLEQEHHQLWMEARDAEIGPDLPVWIFRKREPFETEPISETTRAIVRRHLHKYASPEDVRELDILIEPPEPVH